MTAPALTIPPSPRSFLELRKLLTSVPFSNNVLREFAYVCAVRAYRRWKNHRNLPFPAWGKYLASYHSFLQGQATLDSLLTLREKIQEPISNLVEAYIDGGDSNFLRSLICAYTAAYHLCEEDLVYSATMSALNCGVLVAGDHHHSHREWGRLIQELLGIEQEEKKARVTVLFTLSRFIEIRKTSEAYGKKLDEAVFQ